MPDGSLFIANDVRDQERQHSIFLAVLGPSMAAFTCTMKERNSNNDIRLSPTLLSKHFDDTAVQAHQSFNSNESRIQLSLNYSKNLSSSFVLPSPPPPFPLTFIVSDSEEPIPSESSQSIPVMLSVSSHNFLLL